ncbi:MAG: AsmA family protein, partial [Flavobacteriaceae bacterium]
MNQTLTGIAIAIVLALVTALIAPFFIDWSSYRNSVETRAAEILGRQVRIEGDMELRLLPQPVLRARKVVAGDGETPDITIEQLDMTMSLTPLLSGEISVTEATIRDPVIHLSVDDAGRLTLGGGGDFPVEPEDVSLEHVEIHGGLVLLDDARSGVESRFENVSMTGSAVSLLGPIKAEGTALRDGVVYSFSLQTGRVTPESALRVKLGVLPADRPVAFDSDGVLTMEEGAPVFNGRIRLEGLDLNNQRQLKGPVWRVDADVRATGGAVEAKTATVTIGDPDSGAMLEGDGRLTFGGDARLTAHLSSRQFDLDRHLGGGEQADIPALLGKLGGVVAGIDIPVPVEAELDIGGIV